MAVDTVNKRLSMISFGDFDVAMYAPNASSISDSGERKQLLFEYNSSDSSTSGVRFSRRRRLLVMNRLMP